MSFVKSEERKILAKQDKIENRSRQFVEAGTKTKPNPASVTLEGSGPRPTVISDDKKNTRASAI